MASAAIASAATRIRFGTFMMPLLLALAWQGHLKVGPYDRRGGPSGPPVISPRFQKSNDTLNFASRALRISVGRSHAAKFWFTLISASVFSAL